MAPALPTAAPIAPKAMASSWRGACLRAMLAFLLSPLTFRSPMKRTLLFPFCAASFFLLASPSVWAALEVSFEEAKPRALIIGNGQYSKLVIPTAKEDVNAMSKALQASGADVDAKVDLDHTQMFTAFANFFSQATKDKSRISSLIIYFSGAGFVNSHGKPGVAPIDIVEWSKGGPLNEFLIEDLLEKAQKINVPVLFILDSDFSTFEDKVKVKSTGEAFPPILPRDCAILWAAQPGKTSTIGLGPTSPLTTAFLKYGCTPAGVHSGIPDLMAWVAEDTEGQDTPVWQSSLTKAIRFVQSEAAEPTPTAK